MRSAFASAAFVLAACATLAPGAFAAKPPPESRYYAPCLDRGPVRLHAPGIKVEAVSSEWQEEGVHYVLAAGPGETRGRDGLIRWQDLRGVDIWTPTASSGANRGLVIGALVGAGVMLLATDSGGGFADFFYPMAVVGVALASGLVGSRIGARYGVSAKGHWVPCRSIWYPYGSHASLPESPDDARPSSVPGGLR